VPARGYGREEWGVKSLMGRVTVFQDKKYSGDG
jgi:hypothetical protein